jgi:hypothetical protein
MTSTLSPATTTSQAQSSSSTGSSTATLGIGIGVGIGATIAVIAACFFILRYFRRKEQEKRSQNPPAELAAAPPYSSTQNLAELQTVYNDTKAWHDARGPHGYPQQYYSELSGARRIHEMPGPLPELPAR